MFTFVIKKKRKEKKNHVKSVFSTSLCSKHATMDGWTWMTMQQRNLIPVSPTRGSGASNIRSNSADKDDNAARADVTRKLKKKKKKISANFRWNG